MEETKHCPYCDEIIRVNAIKCKHCGSLLTGGIPDGESTSIAEIKFSLSNRYEILGEIGRGGMASVYKAVQRNLNRMVALKVIHKNLIHYKEFLERFHREAQLSASLNHHNIVTIYDEGSESGIHYIAMEYLEGSDLHRIIQDRGKLGIEETIKIIAPIAEALDYAHNKEIIHRDIKSSNIIITTDGKPVLTDFGIAHAVTATKLTQSGMIIGTPDYMSPEQAITGHVDAQSDLYSLGVVFYECLTGDLPFKGETPVSTIYKIINDKVEPIDKVIPNAPKWLGSVVNKILAKNKKNRFQTGKEFSRALRIKQQFDDFSISEDETIKIPTKEFEKVKRKYHPYLYKKNIFAITTICILLIIAGYFLYNKGYLPFSKKSVTEINLTSLNEFDRKRVELLLEEGDFLFESNNLIMPSGKNAAERFNEVLKIHSENELAKERLNQISTKLEEEAKQLIQKNKLDTAKKLLLSAQQFFPSKTSYSNLLNQIKIKELEIKADGFLSKNPHEAYNICNEIKNIDPKNSYVKTVMPEIKINLIKKANLDFERGNFKEALNSFTEVKNIFGLDDYLEDMISKCNFKIEESNIIRVPNLVGSNIESAEVSLSKYGLLKGKVSEIISSEQNRGKIINQIPKAGTKIKKGNQVNLIIGK